MCGGRALSERWMTIAVARSMPGGPRRRPPISVSAGQRGRAWAPSTGLEPVSASSAVTVRGLGKCRFTCSVGRQPAGTRMHRVPSEEALIARLLHDTPGGTHGTVTADLGECAQVAVAALPAIWTDAAMYHHNLAKHLGLPAKRYPVVRARLDQAPLLIWFPNRTGTNIARLIPPRLDRHKRLPR